jgi:flavin reductase (DIM6/NTAB) family NADH-FMN oxidoreductase RutF
MDLLTVNDAIRVLTDPVLWLVAARADNVNGGFIATSVHGASIVPSHPRVILGVSRHHFTWRLIEKSRCFSLHLFGEEKISWVERFGLRSGQEFDKFSGLAVSFGKMGSPQLSDAVLWVECLVEESMSSGDRTFYLAGVTDAAKGKEGVPLRSKRMRELLRDDQCELMKRRLIRDSEIDAAAIAKWQAERCNR